jgi:hypothetical protein
VGALLTETLDHVDHVLVERLLGLAAPKHPGELLGGV